MRALFVAALLGLLAVLAAPSVAADVVVRTCDSPTMCQEVARAPGPFTCTVDYMKGGLGRPGTVRSSCLSS